MPWDGSNLDEASRVLLRAAEIVEERWCQDELGKAGGPVCGWGAIIEASGGGPEDELWVSAYRRADAAVGGLIRFNDTEGRTKEEVAAALRAAAMQGDGDE